MMKGAVNGLIYLRDNIDVFRDAHLATPKSSITDPNTFFAGLAAKLNGANLEQIAAGLGQNFAHIQPTPLS